MRKSGISVFSGKVDGLAYSTFANLKFLVGTENTGTVMYLCLFICLVRISWVLLLLLLSCFYEYDIIMVIILLCLLLLFIIIFL